MRHTIELVYDSDCPNVERARAQLRQALLELGEEAVWQEWERGSARAPTYVRRYGSPTVLVDGRDVAGDGTESDENCCRVYVGSDGRLVGVPSVEAIQASLRR